MTFWLVFVLMLLLAIMVGYVVVVILCVGRE